MSELLIMRDGEVAEEYLPKEPSVLEATVSHVQAAVSRFTGEVALQARMTVRDHMYGTNYRQIRNELIREKRNREFEQSIGLIALHR